MENLGRPRNLSEAQDRASRIAVLRRVFCDELDSTSLQFYLGNVQLAKLCQIARFAPLHPRPCRWVSFCISIKLNYTQ